MNQVGKILPLGVVLSLTLAAYGQRDDIRKTLTVDIDLALVNVSVTNAKNEVVTDLRPEHFQIFEDKVEQEIRYFSKETTPISVGVIFDVSHSMLRKIQLAREAAIKFLENLTPEDEYFLVEFNNKARLAHPFTTDVLKLRNSLAFNPPDGATAMYDGLYLGLTEVKKGQHPKKALLLITDGEDNHSRYSRKDIREFVREADVQIYSIDMGRALIEELSEMTGGHSYRASLDELEEVCEKIAAELKNQYLIGYVPTNTAKDGGWRKIRVKLNAPPGRERLYSRAKEGYYAPKQ